MLPKDVGDGWEKNGADMKIEILKENLKKQTCKFIITGKEIFEKLPVFISTNELDKNHSVTLVKLFPGTKKEFSFTICNDDICDNTIDDFPSDEYFMNEDYDYIDDVLYGKDGIIDEIEFFKLKCEIFDKRKKLIPWIKQTLIKDSRLIKETSIDYFK